MAYRAHLIIPGLLLFMAWNLLWQLAKRKEWSPPKQDVDELLGATLASRSDDVDMEHEKKEEEEVPEDAGAIAKMKASYKMMKGYMLTAQTYLGQAAETLEQAESLFTWRDQRITGVATFAMFVGALVVYSLGFKFVFAAGFTYEVNLVPRSKVRPLPWDFLTPIWLAFGPQFRHPATKVPLPGRGKNLRLRLPSKDEVML
eukprot:scaffold4066_cov417-Prasinococcus_capsulatus_cf.AAC.2